MKYRVLLRSKSRKPVFQCSNFGVYLGNDEEVFPRNGFILNPSTNNGTQNRLIPVAECCVKVTVARSECHFQSIFQFCWRLALNQNKIRV